jgi:flagellar basal-body rod protein FlgB
VMSGMDWISSPETQLMSRALDGLYMRHQAYSSNLANCDTPGYKHQDIRFNEMMQQAMEGSSGSGELAMQSTRAGHQNAANTQDNDNIWTAQRQFWYRLDDNSVDVEKEMVSLARNTEKFLALSKMQAKKFQGVKSLISSLGTV